MALRRLPDFNAHGVVFERNWTFTAETPAEWIEEYAEAMRMARYVVADSYRDDLYEAIRKGAEEGLSESEMARLAGISRTTVRQALGKG